MAAMGDRGLAMFHGAFCLGALALVGYCVHQAAALAPGQVHGRDTLLLCVAVGVVMLICAAAHAYAACAYHFGRLDAVRGTRACAQLLRSGHAVRAGVRLRVLRIQGQDDANLNDAQRRVLFVSGWRPWACPLDTFDCAAAERAPQK